MPPNLRQKSSHPPPPPNSRPGQPRLPRELLDIVGSYLADDQAYATLAAIQATCRVNRSIGEAYTSRVLFVPIGRENRREALDRVQEVVQAKKKRNAIRVVICQASVADHRIDVVEAIVARVADLLPNLVAAVWWDGKLVKKNSPPGINVKIFRRLSSHRLRLTWLALSCVRTFHQALLHVPCPLRPVVDLKIITDNDLCDHHPRMLYLTPATGPSSVVPGFRKVTVSGGTNEQAYPVSLIATLAVQLARDGRDGRQLTLERYCGNWFDGGDRAGTEMLKVLAVVGLMGRGGNQIHGTAIDIIVQCVGFHRTRDAMPTERQIAERLTEATTSDSEWHASASHYFASTAKMPCLVRLTARKPRVRVVLAPRGTQGRYRLASQPADIRSVDWEFEPDQPIR